MRNFMKKISLLLLSAVLCLSLSACNIQDALFGALENAAQSAIGEHDAENGENEAETTASGFRYCSRATFEASMDQIFYNKSMGFGDYAVSMWCVLILNYNTENGDITSAQVEIKRINGLEWAQDVFDTINTNPEISSFMSNPQIVRDSEWNKDDGYLVTADVALDNVKVNSFIDAYYIGGHNMKALEQEMLEGEIFEDDELGENYTYDAGQGLRIEWFY